MLGRRSEELLNRSSARTETVDAQWRAGEASKSSHRASQICAMVERCPPVDRCQMCHTIIQRVRVHWYLQKSHRRTSSSIEMEVMRVLRSIQKATQMSSTSDRACLYYRTSDKRFFTIGLRTEQSFTIGRRAENFFCYRTSDRACL